MENHIKKHELGRLIIKEPSMSVRAGLKNPSQGYFLCGVMSLLKGQCEIL